MPTTASTILTGTGGSGGVRARLNDTDDQAYADNTLLDYLNDGVEDFALITGCCLKMQEITPGGVNAYINVDQTTLGLRFVTFLAVEYNEAALNQAPIFEARHWAARSSNSTPTAWTFWQVGASTERIYFDYIPAATANIVRIWFTYIPNRISSTSSTVDIPDKWLTAIKAYIEYRIHNANREEGLAARAWAEYQSLRANAVQINEALLSTGGYAK